VTRALLAELAQWDRPDEEPEFGRLTSSKLIDGGQRAFAPLLRRWWTVHPPSVLHDVRPRCDAWKWRIVAGLDRDPELAREAGLTHGQVRGLLRKLEDEDRREAGLTALMRRPPGMDVVTHDEARKALLGCDRNPEPDRVSLWRLVSDELARERWQLASQAARRARRIVDPETRGRIQCPACLGTGYITYREKVESADGDKARPPTIVRARKMCEGCRGRSPGRPASLNSLEQIALDVVELASWHGVQAETLLNGAQGRPTGNAAIRRNQLAMLVALYVRARYAQTTIAKAFDTTPTRVNRLAKRGEEIVRMFEQWQGIESGTLGTESDIWAARRAAFSHFNIRPYSYFGGNRPGRDIAGWDWFRRYRPHSSWWRQTATKCSPRGIEVVGLNKPIPSASVSAPAATDVSPSPPLQAPGTDLPEKEVA
jgi:hypothetical protein